MAQRKPMALIILDGFGVAPPSDSNGVSLARTSNLDKFIANFPVFTLMASGEAVGLSWGEIGNSEVGHINLGGGMIKFQNLPRINKAIQSESFYINQQLVAATEHVKKNNSALHIFGLMSEGKVHSSIDHSFALLDLAKKAKVKKVYLHAFLDGRDSIYNSGASFIARLQEVAEKIGVGEIATVSGRFYAMDRDNHWERTEKTYKSIACGEADEYFKDPITAIENSYERNVFDEEFVPVVIGKQGNPVARVKKGDAIIFMNYRADRARQLTKAFVLDKFDKFDRQKINDLFFVCMTEYEADLPVAVAFSKEASKAAMAGIVSDAGFNQLHIAETEKYAHVTFFFNGGQEEAFKNEDRIVVPSPRVASYAEKPEMSALTVTEKITKAMMQEKHDLYVVNFANPDMVGHTGDIQAVIKAVETVDYCLGQIVDVIMSKGGKCIVTADHGNCEELRNLQTGEISKDHSTNPVPCIIIGDEFKGKTRPESQLVGQDLSLLKPIGLLSDITATTLKLIGLESSEEMTGYPLI